jgi:hypothetical protein
LVGNTKPSTLAFEFQDSVSGTGPDMVFERTDSTVDELITMVRLLNKILIIKTTP